MKREKEKTEYEDEESESAFSQSGESTSGSENDSKADKKSVSTEKEIEYSPQSQADHDVAIEEEQDDEEEEEEDVHSQTSSVFEGTRSKEIERAARNIANKKKNFGPMLTRGNAAVFAGGTLGVDEQREKLLEFKLKKEKQKNAVKSAGTFRF